MRANVNNDRALPLLSQSGSEFSPPAAQPQQDRRLFIIFINTLPSLLKVR